MGDLHRSSSSLWFQCVSKGKQVRSRFTRFWSGSTVDYQCVYFSLVTMFIVSMTVFVWYFFVKSKRYISIYFRWILFRDPVRYVYLTITLFPCRSIEGLQNERIRWIAAQTNNPRSVFSDSFRLHPTERAKRRRHELIAARASYTWACVFKSTQHNVCKYRNFKADECSYIYFEGKANIL